MSSKKILQKDLRQMMKERKQLTQTAEEVVQKKTIESPLARYDSTGRLSCILCDQYIPSDSVWSQHIVSKTHKNKIEEMKRKKSFKKSIETKSIETIDPKVEEVKPLLKRKIESNTKEISHKLTKFCDQMKEENDSMLTNDDLPSDSVPNSTDSGLPNDFFDDKSAVVDTNKPIDTEDTEMDTNSVDNTIPKGFFDDPMMDAKARKVIYKDPIDEQWEQFQRVMAEENTVSENMIEEDVEELQINKNLEEIEEQIANWIKVKDLQQKAEILHKHINDNKLPDNVKEESDSDVDEQELNVFSNWRSRTGLNSK